MKRREFIAALGGATAWPLIARAQQSIPVVGFLSSLSLAETSSLVAVFRRGLTEAGFAENRNVAIQYRWADGQYDRLPALAEDLVNLRVAVIAAIGPPAAHAAKAATSVIPIIFSSGSDPVRNGLVASLNQPGGNISGMSIFASTLGSKRLELLLEMAPGVGTCAMLVNPNYSESEVELAEVRAAAKTRGQSIIAVKAIADPEIEPAFAAASEQRAGAMIVASDPFFNSRRERVVWAAAHYKLPAIYEWREFVTIGGLLSYGAILADVYRQVGVYAGAVLKGAKPAELPILQPTKFELVINRKTAKSLSLEIPPKLLALADEVIE